MPEEDSVTSRLASLTACVSTSSRLVNGKRQGLTNNTNLVIDYLVGRAENLIVIDHPFSVDLDLRPRVETYSRGTLLSSEVFPLPESIARGRHSIALYYMAKVLDIFSSAYFIMRSKRKIDLYVGVEAVNALVGIFLRRIGFIRYVIYDAFDYWPTKFSSQILNSSFLALDRYCRSRADAVWELDESIVRAKRGAALAAHFRRGIIVPPLCPPVDKGNFWVRDSHSIAYLGGLGDSRGVEVAIGAMPLVAEALPDAKLHIVGSGLAMKQLVELARSLGVGDRVSFHGFLTDSDAASVLAGCRVGIAPYLRTKSAQPWFFSFPSKVLYYAVLGLPIVLSNAVHNSSEMISTFKAGLLANPDPQSFAEAILRLMTDESLYEGCLEGCHLLADSLNSERQYERALSQSFREMAEGRTNISRHG